ncbi:MAG: quinol dehydrogenase periplasmic component [Bacteroidetes bacterium ADurb.Bin037]|nr:MAG: quinol dehydrogenase periplasmic component [Bacteroidetes bacterium ADurb.Bin037]HPW78584.1 4Fe-4S dicluster domain-containing protein [Bacteroidales bacterium]HQB56074.1 4Fe-4S dicluster domain-containing protein [Bacteroidales bacterium]
MQLYGFLRWIRRITALAVFLGLVCFFLSFSAKATVLWHALLGLQIVPAILGIASGGLLTVLLVLLITLIFGRIYCSVLCPLGIWQDIVYRTGLFFRNRKKCRMQYTKAHNVLRYSILIIVVLCVAFSFVLPLVWLDPYGLFGKMAVNLGRPLVSLITGSVREIWNPAATFVAAVLFVAISLVAIFKGRLYCNAICPVGSLLGIISGYSMFRVQIDESVCTHCRLCGMSCKSGCIDCNNTFIDHSRCVVCLDCISKCSRQGIHYRFAWKKRTVPSKQQIEQPGIEKGRRAFLVAAIGAGAGIVLLNRFTEKKRVRIPSPMPPGAGSLERLKDTCVACHACIAACPPHIIRPAMGDFGWQGFLLPAISYKNGFCGYDCRKCQEACPTGALRLMPLEEKKRVRIGVVRLKLEHCIIERFGTDCGACDEHCPVKAVQMIPREGTGKVFPKTNPRICIGCGGCEFICPATPKAIEVVPMSEQRLADAPVTETKTKVEVDGSEF